MLKRKGGTSNLLGRYDNFPTTIHRTARFTYQISTSQLQQVILHVFHQLNQQTGDLKNVTRASPANCKVGFEFGVAEEVVFNFLDREEYDRIQTHIKQNTNRFKILDFFCATRYHVIDAEGKRKPLKFDCNLIRFSFSRRVMELFIVHERGIQHIPLEDLVTFLIRQINKELKQRGMKTLTIKSSAL
jgi:hypothetical protein